jgi:hypothetical protein
MVDRSILEIARRYLGVIRSSGIRARRAILFGSHACGKGNPDSDIDLIVIAPEFDGARDEDLVDLLWESRGEADWRIEPFPCGEQEWETNDADPILDLARREGQTIE